MSTIKRVNVNGQPQSKLISDENPKIDSSDPRIRKLVYSMYRDMLMNRNEEANGFISQKDPHSVKQDLGVGSILESIVL